MNTESVANADAYCCLAPCIQGWRTADGFYLCQKFVHPPKGPRVIWKTSKRRKKGTKYDLRPDLCPERLVSVGHRHLLCVSFSVDVRTLAPVVSLLLGCWSGRSPSLMTVVSSQLMRSQGNEMNWKSGQHHCNSALSICSSVMFLKSVHRCTSPSNVSIRQWTPQISSSNKSNCMHAIECNWSVYTFFGYQYYW